MLFVIQVSNKRGNIQEFPVWHEKLEEGLDLVSKFPLGGQTLHKVYVVDRDGKVCLPIELFNGASYTEPLKQLEVQWQDALNKPLPATATGGKRVTNFFQSQIDRYDAQIDQLDLKITNLVSQLEKVRTTRHSPIIKPSLVQHYQLILATCQQHHARLLSLRKQLTTIISQLDDTV